jgi:hypothetical protein
MLPATGGTLHHKPSANNQLGRDRTGVTYVEIMIFECLPEDLNDLIDVSSSMSM